VLKLNDPIKHNFSLALVALGSNIDPEFNISRALSLLEQLSKIIKRGNVWQTPAFGSSGPDYLNISVLLETNLSRDHFKLDVLRQIENQLGRKRTSDKYSDRTIDLDLLIFNQEIMDNDLWSLPHILIPAADVLPDLQIPLTGETLCRAAVRLLPGSMFTKRSDL